jgi:hypothetical protein
VREPRTEIPQAKPAAGGSPASRTPPHPEGEERHEGGRRRRGRRGRGDRVDRGEGAPAGAPRQAADVDAAAAASPRSVDVDAAVNLPRPAASEVRRHSERYEASVSPAPVNLPNEAPLPHNDLFSPGEDIANVREVPPREPLPPTFSAETQPMQSAPPPPQPASIVPIPLALPPDSDLVLVETRFSAAAPVEDEATESPRAKRVRPPRVEMASEPLELVETHKDESPPAH